MEQLLVALHLTASLGLGAFDFDNGATKQITVGTPSILQPADAVTVAAWIRPHYAAGEWGHLAD